MPALDIPFFGTLILSLTLISASYTMAMAMGAGQGRPQLLPSARWGTYATCALVLVAVCVLAYAFQVHDFRIRYVARYSDRSMPWWYLIASLWGGQDGSLLWWAFLLAGYTFFATRWLRGFLRVWHRGFAEEFMTESATRSSKAWCWQLPAINGRTNLGRWRVKSCSRPWWN